MEQSSYFNSSEVFQSRILSALQHGTVQKCNDLASLIQEVLETNIKDIQGFYPVIVENLFAFSSQRENAIDMKIINAQTNPQEFNSLFALLHPEGPMFRLIRYLMCDNYYRCQFPIACLPIPTRAMIEEGIIPEFYINRLSGDGSSLNLTHISLNPFEFYLFHFCYHVFRPRISPVSSEQPSINSSNVLYTLLVEVYLSYFMPLDALKATSGPSGTQDNSSSLWQSLSSTTSILLNLNAGQSSPANLPKSSLLNLKALINHGGDLPNFGNISSASVDQFGSPALKINTLINVFTEMWLNVKVPSSLSKKSHSPSHSSSQALSFDLMKCVLVLVKHLHYFANSGLKIRNRNMINAQFENSEIDEARRTIWSDKYLIQRRLFSFFRVAFDKWPLDASFRMPLECWLSFIQPWRYIDPANSTKSDADDRVIPDSPSGAVDSCWKKFITDNVLFYTSLFHQLLPRFLRMNFGSSKNAFMVLRVIKVYSQPNLKQLIQEAEESLQSAISPLRSTGTRGALLSPIRSPRNALHQNTIYKHELELDQADFHYISLFSSSKPEVVALLKYIITSRKEIRESMIARSKRDEESFNFLNFVKSFSSGDDYREIEEEMELSDKMKTDNYLDQVFFGLKSLFDVDENCKTSESETPQSDSPSIGSRMHSDSPMATPRSAYGLSNLMSSNTPSSIPLRSRSLFSPNLRNAESDNTMNASFSEETQEIDRKMKNKHIAFYGNPDEQPVRSFEFYWLVLFLRYISGLINKHYQPTFVRLYSRLDFVGSMSRAILHGPTTYVMIEKHEAFMPPLRTEVKLEPRICLRSLASRTLYGYLLVLYLTLYLFGFGKWTFLFVISFIFLFKVLLNALFDKPKSL